MFKHPMLAGSIATELGLLTNLESFGIRGTSITGTIPSELGRFTSPSFWVLAVDDMRLTGTIPTEIFRLKAGEFWLSDNMLEGTIPTEVGSAKNASTFGAW